MAVSFVDFESGVGDLDGRVEDRALGRFVDAEGFGAESRFNERDHLVGVAEMEIGLDTAKSLRAGSPAFGHGDVPDVAERVFDAALTVARRMVVGRRIDGEGAGMHRAGVSGARVVDVEMDGGWPRRMLVVGIAKLDDGVADTYLGVHDEAVRPGNADAFNARESRRQKFNELGGPVDQNDGRDVIEARTPEMSGPR